MVLGLTKERQQELLKWLKSPDADEEDKKAEEESQKIEQVIKGMHDFNWKDLQKPYSFAV